MQRSPSTLGADRAQRPSGAGAPPKRSHPHRRWWLLGILGVIGLVLIVSLVLAIRGRAHSVSTNEALKSFHAGGVATVPHPTPGVYGYAGSGTERLSLPPLSQGEGPTLPGTVEVLSKTCWLFRIDYSSNHWQTWTYCWHPAGLEEAGGQTWQRWMVGPVAVTNLSTFRCDAGSMVLPTVRRPGQVWQSRCVGTSSAVSGQAVTAGPYRFVGTDTLTIGGRSVRAAHFLRLRTMSGSQVGTERSDVWYDAGTGLPLEDRRTIEVRTETAFGSSTYNEAGSWTIRSVIPVR